MARTNRGKQGERGVALIQTAIGIVALMGLTVVGVDVGHITFTATEVQQAADIAALAGAKALVEGRAARGDAEIVLGANKIDGTGATNNLDTIETGTYDFETATFTPGGTPAIAVRASTSDTVDNFLAGIFGFHESHVTKIATASFATLGGGTPTLPIAIGDENFDEDCFDDACMPMLIQVPSGQDTTAWTGFFAGANTSNISDFFPTECGGEGETAPTIHVDDSITLNNGEETPLLSLVDCLVNVMGINEFLVPIVDSSSFNQTGQVVGFATIVVDSVTTTGNPKEITLHAVFNASEPGIPGGGGNFGTGFIILVG